MSEFSGKTVDLFDVTRSDYKRPNCAICGRLAGRDKWTGEWSFACVFWTGEGWEHK